MQFILDDGTEVDISIPRWIKYIAQDGDKEWFGYAKKPTASKSMSFWMLERGTYEYLCMGLPPDDWTQELYKVYRKET